MANFCATNKMEHLQNLNVYSSCRTCLGNFTEIHQNIFEIPGIKEKFTACTSLSIEAGDGYPISLCEACRTKIDDFYNFQQMCISAKKRFQDYIDSEKKPCTFELGIDTNNLPGDLKMLEKEFKKELEESNMSHDEYLEFDTTELLNEQSQEESNDDQPIIKYQKLSKKLQQTKASENFKHAELNRFPCDLCEKSYTRQGSLKLHIQTQHEGISMEKFRCTETGCNRTMCSKLNLLKHIKNVHHPKGTKLRQHKRKLKEHMNKHAVSRKNPPRKTTKPVNVHTKKKQYTCQLCGRVLHSVHTFKMHKRLVHEGVKDCPCSYCDKSFGTNYTRKLHEMIHTGEKPNECNICQMKFIQPTALTRHKKTHLKVEAWQRNG